MLCLWSVLALADYAAAPKKPIDLTGFWILNAAASDDPEALLRAYLPRLTKLSGPAIGRYKRYMLELSDIVSRAKPMAVAANRTMFDDPTVRRNISRYVAEMKLPWEE